MRNTILLPCFSLLLAPAAFGAPVPRYEVRRATSAIVVDGKLDDPAWAAAPAVTFLFPWKERAEPKRKTTARLLWDDRYLYVGYECEDTDITAQYTERDDPTYEDDAVEIFINPRPSALDYYGLEMNVRAVLYDYVNLWGRKMIKSVDFVGVQLATNIRGTLNMSGDRDEGWSLELAIPWRNFADLTRELPPAPGAMWTAGLNRLDGPRSNRSLSMWSDPERPSGGFHVPQRFGQLVFVK